MSIYMKSMFNLHVQSLAEFMSNLVRCSLKMHVGQNEMLNFSVKIKQISCLFDALTGELC